MNFEPALDGLLDLLAEAVVRELQMQNPAATAGFHKNVPSVTGGWNDERLPHDTDPPQAAST